MTHPHPRQYDVRDFGAVGDGRTDDTDAVQAAIHACARSGGGIVLLHDGHFSCGGLRLQSHVQLHLTSTAALQGVAKIAAYIQDEQTPYRHINRSLLWAQDCEHIAITGDGIIDGMQKFFGGEEDVRPTVIRLRNCRHVRIGDVLVKDSPSWALHLIQCRQVRIEGLRIDSRGRPNNDGIDVDGCEDVFITNCIIHSGDDSIALKALEPGHPCRDVVIANCILSSQCAAVRIGPDAVSDIERVTMSNCVIRDTRLGAVKIQQSLGAKMRRMAFSNLILDHVAAPISLRLAGWAMGSNKWAVFDDSAWEQGEVSDISFTNIHGTCPTNDRNCISITGTPHARPCRITFSHVRVTFGGGGTAVEARRREVPDHERCYPEIYMFGVLPAYACYLHHTDAITLDHVRFETASDDLRAALVADDVQELDICDLRARGNPGSEALIILRDVRNVDITDSRPLNVIPTFALVEGAGSRAVVLPDNVRFARERLKRAPEVRPQEIT